MELISWFYIGIATNEQAFSGAGIGPVAAPQAPTEGVSVLPQGTQSIAQGMVGREGGGPSSPIDNMTMQCKDITLKCRKTSCVASSMSKQLDLSNHILVCATKLFL